MDLKLKKNISYVCFLTVIFIGPQFVFDSFMHYLLGYSSDNTIRNAALGFVTALFSDFQ